MADRHSGHVLHPAVLYLLLLLLLASTSQAREGRTDSTAEKWPTTGYANAGQAADIQTRAYRRACVSFLCSGCKICVFIWLRFSTIRNEILGSEFVVELYFCERSDIIIQYIE